jgi:hypothetical protein
MTTAQNAAIVLTASDLALLNTLGIFTRKVRFAPNEQLAFFARAANTPQPTGRAANKGWTSTATTVNGTNYNWAGQNVAYNDATGAFTFVKPCDITISWGTGLSALSAGATVVAEVETAGTVVAAQKLVGGGAAQEFTLSASVRIAQAGQTLTLFVDAGVQAAAVAGTGRCNRVSIVFHQIYETILPSVPVV